MILKKIMKWKCLQNHYKTVHGSERILNFKALQKYSNQRLKERPFEKTAAKWIILEKWEVRGWVVRLVNIGAITTLAVGVRRVQSLWRRILWVGVWGLAHLHCGSISHCTLYPFCSFLIFIPLSWSDRFVKK